MALACLGFSAPSEGLFLLFCGWALYLARVIPEIQFSASGWLTFAVCGTLFAAGLHLIANRLIGTNRTSPSQPPHAWSMTSTARVVGLIVVLFTAGIAIVGVSHQVIWLLTSPQPLVTSSWEASTRSRSQNNLKQIGLAAHNYHDLWQSFPAGGDLSQTGVPMHSWATRLLPYLDEAPLHQQIDLTLPWSDARNAEQFQTIVSALSNPGLKHLQDGMSHQHTPDGYAAAHYAGNIHVLPANALMSLQQIEDGSANTILAGEVIAGFRAWGDPLNLRNPARGIDSDPLKFCGPWQLSSDHRLVNFMMCDGTVRTVGGEIDPQVLRAISTPAGGENLENVDF